MSVAIKRRLGALILCVALALGTVGAMGHNAQEARAGRTPRAPARRVRDAEERPRLPERVRRLVRCPVRRLASEHPRASARVGQLSACRQCLDRPGQGGALATCEIGEEAMGEGQRVHRPCHFAAVCEPFEDFIRRRGLHEVAAA